jgi:GT2 family glycosyltransferase
VSASPAALRTAQSTVPSTGPARELDVDVAVVGATEVAVSVVVVAFHRPASLARLLDAVIAPGLEVVVVNVGDDPAVTDVIAAAAHDVVEIGVPGNPGFAAGVNVGVAAAQGDVVVFMNDDATLGPADLRALTDAVVAGADVAVPRVVDSDGRVERTIAALPTPTALAREWLLLPDAPVGTLGRHLRVEKWRLPTRPERVDAAAAVAVAARRSLVVSEPMPEDYFLYWEESEWFWNLRERGARVEYRPEATCRHDGGRADVRPEKSRLLARNAVRCVRRTQGRGAGVAAYAIVLLWNARLAVADGARAGLGRVPRAQAHARRAGLRAAVGSWRELR